MTWYYNISGVVYDPSQAPCLNGDVNALFILIELLAYCVNFPYSLVG